MQRHNEVVDGTQCVGNNGVVHPSPFFAITDKACIAQHFEMKRQPRLRRVEFFLQFANTALFVLEHVEYVEPSFVGECVKEGGGVGEIAGGCSGHG